MRHTFSIDMELPNDLDDQKLAQIEDEMKEMCAKTIIAQLWTGSDPIQEGGGITTQETETTVA